MGENTKHSEQSNVSKPLGTGPYGPKNNLHSSTGYHGTTSDQEQPKFGSTTPLKATIPGTTVPWKQAIQDQYAQGNNRPNYVSRVNSHAAELLQPVRPVDFRRVVDLTKNDEPQIIQRPSNVPTFSSGPYQQNPGLTAANANFVDLTRTAHPVPYQIPSYQPYGGEYVDPEKTTKSIQELLEGFNDEPIKRKKKKKTEKTKKTKPEVSEKVGDELAAMMEGTALKDEPTLAEPDAPVVIDAEVDAPEEEEEVEEEEEEEEEEEDRHVDGLNVELLPHQVRGLEFLQSREEGKSKGGILADDMGLGKTVQSIALILSHPHPAYPFGEGNGLSSAERRAAREEIGNCEKSTLVIAPLALIKQWEREIDSKTEPTHKVRVLVHHGPKRTTDPRDLRRYDVVITTYDTIRSEHTKSMESDDVTRRVGVFGLRWWRIICDEAHTIKNRNAKQTKAAYDLKARYKWCLTGTPLQNNLEELQSLFKFLKIAPLDDLAAWKQQIALPMKANKGNLAIERLRVVLDQVMLRRTKAVLKKDADNAGPKSGTQLSLGERHVQKVVANFGETEQAFYEKLETRTEESIERMLSGFGGIGNRAGQISYTSALILLLRLRQACNHPHLLAGKIHKDKDSSLGLATPRKKRSAMPSQEEAQEEDELADLMGGLSVDQKKCEVCLANLSPEDLNAGEIRCEACNNDLAQVAQMKMKAKKKKEKREKREKREEKIKKPERRRRAVLDSDDEEGEDEPKPEGDGEGSQAEEGSDTEEEGDTSFVSDNDDGLIDSQAEETDDDGSDYDDDPSSQLFPSTKILKLLEILRAEHKEKNKTIVFSQFTSMLDLIEPFLYQEGIAFTRYDGSMKNDDREASLRRLRGEGEFAPRKGKEGKDWCGVLLCSLKCGALGLNLTAACRVVILEPFWNPAIEEQAIDRVHRIGQKKDVVVYKLTIEDSVEQRIVILQDQKRKLAEAAIGNQAGKANAAKLSLKEMLNLFRHDAVSRSTKNMPELNAKIGLLKEVRRAPEDLPPSQGLPPSSVRQDIAGGRYTSEEVEEQKEHIRLEEMKNPFGRR